VEATLLHEELVVFLILRYLEDVLLETGAFSKASGLVVLT